jgi:glucose-1-phosphate adenylyltransferase
MDRTIVILAGGTSSRMKKSVDAHLDATLAADAKTKSKAMLGVGESGRPFLDYLLYNVEKAGYENVLIVVGEKDNSIRQYYEQDGGSKHFPHLKISFVAQRIPDGRKKPLGTADALLQALQAMPSWKGQHLTVCNSDNLYSQTALRLLLEDKHENAMIDYDRDTLQCSHERVSQFAVIMKDSNGFLADIIEKPSREDVEQAKDSRGRIGVSMNIWRFSYNSILPYLEAVPLHPVRQEKELPVAVKMMVAKNPRSLLTMPLSEHVVDLTSQADIPIVQEFLRKEYPNF